MTTGARVGLLFLAGLQTTFSVFLTRAAFSTAVSPEEVPASLGDAARKWRIAVFFRVGYRFVVSLFLWTLALFGSLPGFARVGLLALLVLVVIGMIATPALWRKDIARLRAAGYGPPSYGRAMDTKQSPPQESSGSESR